MQIHLLGQDDRPPSFIFSTASFSSSKLFATVVPAQAQLLRLLNERRGWCLILIPLQPSVQAPPPTTKGALCAISKTVAYSSSFSRFHPAPLRLVTVALLSSLRSPFSSVPRQNQPSSSLLLDPPKRGFQLRREMVHGGERVGRRRRRRRVSGAREGVHRTADAKEVRARASRRRQMQLLDPEPLPAGRPTTSEASSPSPSTLARARARREGAPLFSFSPSGNNGEMLTARSLDGSRRLEIAPRAYLAMKTEGWKAEESATDLSFFCRRLRKGFSSNYFTLLFSLSFVPEKLVAPLSPSLPFLGRRARE